MRKFLWIPTLSLATTLFVGSGLQAFATDRYNSSETPPAEVVDKALKTRVENALKSDGGLTGSQLQVIARDGVITLAGTVPDEMTLLRAMDLVSSTQGVREVRSAMNTAPGE